MRRHLFLIAFLCVTAAAIAQVPLSALQLPQGFTIELYADDVDGARSLTLGSDGTVYIGTRAQGLVYAVPDRNGDGRGDEVIIIDSRLNSPNGVAFRDGDLYVAEIDRILRYDDIGNRLGNPPEPVVVFDELPSDAHHGWKFIAFGPDGRLYIPIGAPCNVCEKSDERYAGISRINYDGTGFEIFAYGIRNTVGFSWHPETGELWFTDNGRDFLGDTRPPDELNRAPVPGLHFGFPYLHGSAVTDPQFGGRGAGIDFTLPELELGAHVAALGMRFYTGTMFPEEYQGQIFIAEHGSWNSTVPVGYRISLVRLEEGRAVSYEPFITGWLQGRISWGRPVDLLVMPDGSMLISDDKRGAVYRVTHK
ncbi:MAG: sorbosone dehydrogenase family protein [Spirochaetales bacterium]|nr:sorbosone dehydrogenase family protein [Spirochaetales bacterium]